MAPITVLIIDDDVLLTASLATSLSEKAFRVYIASSGREGIELFHQVKPDVVMLDLMMPGMSGWDVCRQIRTFSQVPILVLSAVTNSDLVMQVLMEGATDYLVKPVPLGVMISQLKRLAALSNSH